MNESGKILVGVSTCLLGERVRYNGDHKRDNYIVDILADYFKWVPVCPEVEIGLGTPREAIRLVREDQRIKLKTTQTEIDLTEQMTDYSQDRVETLSDLNGYILKKDSPSCGMERVKVYDQNGIPGRTGMGIYAKALLDRFPNLPIEEEGRLNDPSLRENFVTRVYTYNRWRVLIETASISEILNFHAAHKMLILAHNPFLYREMGQLLASQNEFEWSEILQQYESLLMKSLRRPATRRRHVNVLQHLCGFLKRELDSESKRELHDVIEDYRLGLSPLIAPLTLLQHHLRKIAHPWVESQIYLEPYPKELALRSQI